MVTFLILAIVMAVALFVLHYGFKLAFFYDDPLASPYEYPDDDQTRACAEVLNAAIRDYESVPFEEVSIRSRDGLLLTGRYYHVCDGAPLQILCHGYKGNAIRDFCGSWRVARDIGHNVLLIDQRCHGGSEGYAITFGILEKQDVMDWIRYARKRFGNVPMVLSGVSMGAATVLMAAGQDLPENVRAVIADCPYDSPANIIKKVLSQDMKLPVKLVYPLIRLAALIYGRFNLNADSPVQAVTRANVPILLIHGDDDRFVPYEMSVNIHAAAPETVEFHTIPGAGHALNFAAAPLEFSAIIRDFLREHL